MVQLLFRDGNMLVQLFELKLFLNDRCEKVKICLSEVPLRPGRC